MLFINFLIELLWELFHFSHNCTILNARIAFGIRAMIQNDESASYSSRAYDSPWFGVMQYRFGRFSLPPRNYIAVQSVVRKRAIRKRLLTLVPRRYESYRYPFIYGCPSDRPFRCYGASGIILASGVICGHLALARRLIATGAAAGNSRGPS